MSGPHPTALLATDRLWIRPWTLDDEDAAAFHRIWGNPQVIWWDHAVDAAESLRVLRRVLSRAKDMPRGLGWWAVEEKQSGRVVGGVMLQPASYVDGVELGYHIAHESWGRGYATEAAGAVLGYALGPLALPRVVAAIHPENFASRRVVEKLGMAPAGQVLHADVDHDLYVADRS